MAQIALFLNCEYLFVQLSDASIFYIISKLLFCAVVEVNSMAKFLKDCLDI